MRAEAEGGLKRGILVPVSIEDTNIPLLFRPIQSIRLMHWEGDSNHPQFAKLISDLSPILGPSPKKVKEAEQLCAGEEKRRKEQELKRKAEEVKFFKDEQPPYPVEITKPFYLQTTEVSQGQWKRVIGDNPSGFKDCGNECPVEDVSWNDAQKFINKLNQMEGTKKYRYPSEAEWE